MAVVLEIIDLLVCRKIHGCGCFADNPAPRESVLHKVYTLRLSVGGRTDGQTDARTHARTHAQTDGKYLLNIQG